MADPDTLEGPGELPADAARVRERGLTLLVRLHGVLRGLKLYDAGNRAQHHYQQDLLAAVIGLESEEVTLLGMGEYVYVNGLRLRPDASQLPIFRGVLAALRDRHVAGLRIGAEVTIPELEAFLRVFHTARGEGAAEAFEAHAASGASPHVSVVLAREGEGGDGVGGDGGANADERHRTRLVFRRAVDETRALMDQAAETGKSGIKQAKRVVQPMVDRLLRNENSLVGLTALKRHDQYTYAHCVNVSILSIRIGQWLGLSRGELASLGVAALLHDTGKLVVPAAVLGKPGQLDPHEWELVRRHPLEGLRILSRVPGISELMLDAMRVAFEHHMHIDHTGYPRTSAARELGAFSRIVAVADIFDAVTAHRAYRRRPLTPHEALRLLLGHESAHFDRAVLWALVQAVGLYPAGTLLRTHTGRTWLSIAPSSVDPARPICRQLHVGEVVTMAPPEEDVALRELETVTHVIAPEDLDADVQELLAA